MVIDDVFDSAGRRPEPMKAREFYDDVRRRLGAGTNEGCGVAAGHWSHCHAAKAYITAVAAMPSRVTSLAFCFFLRVPGAGLG